MPTEPPPKRPHLRLVPNPDAGELTTCSRCGEPVRVASTRNLDARMLQHAASAADGHCVNCATAAWFVAMEMREDVVDPQVLLRSDVQAAYGRIMQASGADAKPAEINWPKVVEHWHLPFATRRRTARSKKKPPAS